VTVISNRSTTALCSYSYLHNLTHNILTYTTPLVHSYATSSYSPPDVRFCHEGMGRSVPAIAAHRCDLRAWRRSRAYAPKVHDGAAGKADAIASQVPSEGADVDVAAKFFRGVDD